MDSKMTDIDSADPIQLSFLCFAMCSFCGFFIGLIAYIVFGIIYLVDDADVCSEFSPLWMYGLLSLILPCMLPCVFGYVLGYYQGDIEKSNAAYESKDFGVIVGLSATKFFPNFGLIAIMIIYGGIVIYGGYTCDAMKSEGLYIWALVTLYRDIVFFALFVVWFAIFVPQYFKFSKEFDDFKRTQANESTPEETTPLQGSKSTDSANAANAGPNQQEVDGESPNDTQAQDDII